MEKEFEGNTSEVEQVRMDTRGAMRSVRRYY